MPSYRHVLAASALALLVGCPKPAPSPATSAAAPSPRPRLSTVDDAWRFVEARLLAAEGASLPDDAYAASWVRTYEGLDGRVTHWVLADRAERELALAGELHRHGFFREAYFHYRNAAAREAPDIEAEAECLAHLVEGRVRPGWPVYLAGDSTYVPARPRPVVSAASDGWPVLDEIRRGSLPEVPELPPDARVIGSVGRHGVLTPDVCGDWQPPEEPVVWLRMEGLSRSLPAAEREFKLKRLDAWLAKLASWPEGLARSLGRARVWLGDVEGARDLMGRVHGDLRADPPATSECFALDEAWRSEIASNPRFSLSAASGLAVGGPLRLTAKAGAVGAIEFRMERLLGEPPLVDAALETWLKDAATEPAVVRTVPVAAGESTVELPLPSNGTWRVRASAGGREASFTAVRVDEEALILAFPGERQLVTLGGALRLATRGGVVGPPDAEGLLALTSPLMVLDRLCEEHRECCATCESCLHHHQEEGNDAMVLGSLGESSGAVFRIRCELDDSKVRSVKAPTPATMLLAYTDRPAYKVGDTIRFRGIVRRPKMPLNRRDAQRIEAAVDAEVVVTISGPEDTIFRRTYRTGSFGTFHGEFQIPLAAARGEYALSVEMAGTKASQAFDVADYRRNDYLVTLDPEPGGLRVRGGYVWGSAVPGAELQATVNGRPAAIRDGFVAAPAGARVAVSMVREGTVLARKAVSVRDDAPSEPSPAGREEPSQPTSAPAAGPAPTTAPPPPAGLTIRAVRPVVRRGEPIELEITGGRDGADALVVLGDVQLYDVAHVKLHGGSAVVRLAARPIHDPGVGAFVVSDGRVAMTEVRVHTSLLKLDIAAPARARPGDVVTVTLKTEPGAELSLAAIDEAITMIREDATPHLYGHFHPARPAALAVGRLAMSFDPVSVICEAPPQGRPVPDLEDGRVWSMHDPPPRGDRRGMAFGGRRLAAGGGGGSVTEDAVQAGLRVLARRQQADGSWSDDLETCAGRIDGGGATALSLLAFLGAGYSHLSRDTHDGICFGEVVRKGLQRLISLQGPDGHIGGADGDTIVNHLLAALALSEAFGLTGSQLFKDAAQSAIDRSVALERPDGGWHPAKADSPARPATSVLGVMVLRSAQLAGLVHSRSASDRAWSYFDQLIPAADDLEGRPRPELSSWLLASSYLRTREERDRPGAILSLIAADPAGAVDDLMTLHIEGLAVYQWTGPRSRVWKNWSERIRASLKAREDASGAVTVGGRVVVPTALAAMVLQVYYRYANVFGVAGAEGDGRSIVPLAAPPRVRLYFPDTAFWAPDLVADEKGEARAVFRLTDEVTTTRLTSRGVAGPSCVGQAVARIEARPAFFLQLRAPEFLVVGDEVDIRADVFNQTRAALDADVGLEGGARHTVRVSSDRPASVSWRLSATSVGDLVVRVAAKAGVHQDSIQRTIPVRPRGRERIVTARAKLEPGGRLEFDVPEGATDLSVRARAGTAAIARILEALRWLNDYPHG